ncbi:hypothetical protein VDG1235_4814 [Verrucomicrobiia bacterium DG1235]|nr:hypothetical protein VDG1235_4814 [Verrucomicrobiae bacterium DG1235]
MPAEKLIVADAIVLKLSPTGEKFTQVRLLSPEIGLLSLLKRNRAKTSSFSIDLFDQGEAHIDHKPGESSNNGFLTDFIVSKKRSGIGKSYRSLQAASWLSSLLLANPLHEGNQEDTFHLAQKAYDSLSEGLPPQSIMLKTLYLFARDEGYPVVEDWARKLPESLSRNAATLLNTPLSEIRLKNDEQQATLNSLAHYIEHNTHIHLPRK